MARKPNYRFQRAELERLQAERQARRDLRKARSRADAANASKPTAGEPAEAHSSADLPEHHDG